MGFDKSLLPVSKDAKVKAAQKLLTIPKKPMYNQPKKAMEAFKLLKLRVDKLQLLGKALDETKLGALVRSATEVLECLPETIRPIIQNFNKCRMDKRTIDLLCWQIAGNRKRAKDMLVPLYTGKPEEMGWMAGVVAEHLADDQFGSTRGSYRIRIMDGPAAGADMFMPVPKSLGLLSDVLGATYKLDSSRIKMSDYKQAVQMSVIVYPEAMPVFNIEHNSGALHIKCDTRVDAIRAIRCTYSQKKDNQALVKARNELCQIGYRHPCHVCKIGYDACARACRAKTVVSETPEVTLLIKGNNICQTQSLEEV